ncbi:JAB domain-containing protein [Herbidospora mongoliensis]|uniref:JAB domain-containing protein n=1 Tax=Herbidospora mongoliensis TaxID=688067 RepID=UPI000A6E304F|nr:DNA repair protein RadC [Herbidospora mongoliensis]
MGLRVKDMAAGDQPRERLLEKGGNALADRELLAILLGSGSRGMSAVELASRVISHCGDLGELARSEPHRLLSVPGVGPAKAARVAAAFHLVRRSQSSPGPLRITTSADLAALVAPLLREQAKERLVLVVCDTGGGVLRQSVITEGGSDHTSLPVRDVITAVLTSGGAAFGVAHNHPSGSIEPSPADVASTDHLRRASDIVGLTFLDHLVVTDTRWRRVA